MLAPRLSALQALALMLFCSLAMVSASQQEAVSRPSAAHSSASHPVHSVYAAVAAHAQNLETDVKSRESEVGAPLAQKARSDALPSPLIQKSERIRHSSSDAQDSQNETTDEELQIKNEELGVSRRQAALAAREKRVESKLLKERSLMHKEQKALSTEYQIETSARRRTNEETAALTAESLMLSHEKRMLEKDAAVVGQRERMAALASQRVKKAAAGVEQGVDQVQKDAGTLTQFAEEVEKEKESLAAEAKKVGAQTAIAQKALKKRLSAVVKAQNRLAAEKKVMNKEIADSVQASNKVIAEQALRDKAVEATLKEENVIRKKEAATAQAQALAHSVLAATAKKQSLVTAHQEKIRVQEQAEENKIASEKEKEKNEVFKLQDEDAKRQNDVLAIARLQKQQKQHLAALAVKEKHDQQTQVQLEKEEAAVTLRQKQVSAKELSEMNRLDDEKKDEKAQHLVMEARAHAAAEREFHVREGELAEKSLGLERESEELREKQARIAKAETKEANRLHRERQQLREEARDAHKEQKSEAKKWHEAIAEARKQLAKLKAAKKVAVAQARALTKERNWAEREAKQLKMEEETEKAELAEQQKQELLQQDRLRVASGAQSLASLATRGNSESARPIILKANDGKIVLSNDGVNGAELLENHVHVDAKSASGAPLRVALHHAKHSNDVDVIVTAGVAPPSAFSPSPRRGRAHAAPQQGNARPVIVVINNHTPAAPTASPRSSRPVYIPFDPSTSSSHPPEYINVRYHLRRKLGEQQQPVGSAVDDVLSRPVVVGHKTKIIPSPRKQQHKKRNGKKMPKMHHFHLPADALKKTKRPKESYEQWLQRSKGKKDDSRTKYWISTPHKTDKSIANPAIKEFDWSSAEDNDEDENSDFSKWVKGMWKDYFGTDRAPKGWTHKMRRLTYDIPANTDRASLDDF